ncbi:hypothetical protein KGF57_000711 [Candida theae]|uniref:Uncharacterized protein n=1 Tax=Candida theae TaxID=1198502 RepID=A0AAD5G0A9_9ASCO|nr:uncharacterized protein KGF57_000711 [Candida theae]KAI5965445.1 hypothetical protein KGF57_000711 [Candida theae]
MQLFKFVELAVVTVVMATTTFISSIAPIKFLNLSSANLNYLTNFSMGILVGTALLIVLPEGIQVLSEGMYGLTSFTVGVPILIGVVLMFTIDKFVAHNDKELYNSPPGYSDATTTTTTTTTTTLGEARVGGSIANSILQSSTTLGLLVHAAVDGVSLGSSFANKDSTLQFAMVIALIIHKIPTAFSLGTILSKEGMQDNLILIHLGLFALSTPISTWVTFAILAMSSTQIQFFTGSLLLFSSGTFLYVVYHVVHEFEDGLVQEGDGFGGGGSSGSENTLVDKQAKKKNIFVAIVGLVIPLLLSLIKEE